MLSKHTRFLKSRICYQRQYELLARFFVFTKGAVMILRKPIPNCLLSNGNRMPLWQFSLSLRESNCSIENSSINRLGIIRSIANPSIQGTLKRHLDQNIVRCPLFLSHTQTRLRKWCTQTSSIFSPKSSRFDLVHVRLHFDRHSHWRFPQ